jgi:hypothetical protein
MSARAQPGMEPMLPAVFLSARDPSIGMGGKKRRQKQSYLVDRDEHTRVKEAWIKSEFLGKVLLQRTDVEDERGDELQSHDATYRHDSTKGSRYWHLINEAHTEWYAKFKVAFQEAFGTAFDADTMDIELFQLDDGTLLYGAVEGVFASFYDPHTPLGASKDEIGKELDRLVAYAQGRIDKGQIENSDDGDGQSDGEDEND